MFVVGVGFAIAHLDQPGEADIGWLWSIPAVGIGGTLVMILGAAEGSLSNNGKPAIVAALKGVGLFALLASAIGVPVGLNWWQDKVASERRSDNQTELFALFDDASPVLPDYRRSQLRGLTEEFRFRACNDDENLASFGRGIEVNDGVAEAEHVYDLLVGDGFDVELRRIEGPLDTYEVIEILAVNGDVFVHARSLLWPERRRLEVTRTTGPCVGDHAEDLLQRPIEPGVAISADFSPPQLDGLALTDLPAKSWTPYTLSRLPSAPRNHCPSGTTFHRGGTAKNWRWVDVDDPHRSALTHFNDLATALDADGWKTSHLRTRITTPGSPDEEHRVLRALLDDRAVVMQAIYRANPNLSMRYEVVDFRMSAYHGSCLSETDSGWDVLGQLAGGPWSEVDDPLTLDPLKPEG